MEPKYKRYLERLRRNGSVNMFGAAPYLKEAFDLRDGEARAILREWMDTYDPNDPEYAKL